MQSAASARPKPLSLLDMPQGEVFAGHSTCLSPLHVGPAGSNLQQCASSPKQAPEQQQQQQQQQSLQALRQMASPLMLSAKLYKPSIADVVMQLRAADQVQVRNASFCCFAEDKILSNELSANRILRYGLRELQICCVLAV